MIDRDGLAAFLRRRRASSQPEDVGLGRRQRRRTDGLRRQEGRALPHVDGLLRAAGAGRGIAALRADDRLDRAGAASHAGRARPRLPPRRASTGRARSGQRLRRPGSARVLDRLADTPAEIISELGETLLQSPLGIALTGDARLRRGPDRSVGYRWFTDPAAQAPYPPEERHLLTRVDASGLRELVALRGPASRAARLAASLQDHAEFRAAWDAFEVGVRPTETKRFLHPDVGPLELHCQTLLDPDQSHRLLVYTAAPGSDSHERLQLLAVIGATPTAP